MRQDVTLQIPETGIKLTLRERFEAEDRQLTLRLVRNLILIAMTLMVLSSALDAFVYPSFFQTFLLLRLACAFLLWLVLLSLISRVAHQWYRAYTILVPLLPAAFIAVMIYLSGDPGSPYYAGLTLCLVAIAVMFQWTFQESLIALALILGLYCAAAIPHLARNPAAAMGAFASNSIFIILNGTLVTAASFMHRRIRVAEFISREKIRRQRETLKHRNDRLRELDRIRRDFIASITHELRTPLTVLLTPLQLFRQRKDLEEYDREIYDVMFQQAMRLLKLINDLLDIAKIEAGSHTIHPTVIHPGRTVEEIVRELQPVATSKGLRLSAETLTGESLLTTDADKLDKILLNLLINAVKFTPEGGQITCSVTRSNGEFVFTVADTGQGIPPSSLPFIFDRFWQGDSTLSKKEPGTGLGLALVKEFIALMKGRIEVESTLGSGTTFRIHLPSLRESSETTSIAAPQRNLSGLSKIYRQADIIAGLEK
jgi:signal transduction histidine kinase